MKLFLPPEIEQYAHDHTRPRGALLDELAAHTHAHVPYPQMLVGRVEGALLATLAALLGARRILEIGTYTGYSALCMAAALPDDGEIVTCEIDAAVAATARGFFDRSEHGRKIRIEVGDARDTLARLDARPFDMAFVDADKERYPDYYEAVLPRLRPGGLLAADNVLWSGEALDPRSPGARAIAAFNERVQRDPRVDNVLLPVRDGLMLARKL
jgi:caffeoyl-CoA O-methyltransferase